MSIIKRSSLLQQYTHANLTWEALPLHLEVHSARMTTNRSRSKRQKRVQSTKPWLLYNSTLSFPTPAFPSTPTVVFGSSISFIHSFLWSLEQNCGLSSSQHWLDRVQNFPTVACINAYWIQLCREIYYSPDSKIWIHTKGRSRRTSRSIVQRSLRMSRLQHLHLYQWQKYKYYK